MAETGLGEWALARRAMVDAASQRVVAIEPARGRRFSGIAWNADTVVTAAEALCGADAVGVDTPGGPVEATIVALDLGVDVAVLRVRAGAPPVVAAPPGALRSGDDVLIAGRAGGLRHVAWSHALLVGPAWRSRRGGELARLIRLAPGLAPTLEGAGVFDVDGALCAMAVPGPGRSVLGIPAETIAQVVATVERHGRLPQPWLGVRLQAVALDDDLRTGLGHDSRHAALVVGVEPGSPARDAGLLFGDLILSVGDRTIRGAVDLKGALAQVAPGATLDVQLFRAGARCAATVTVRERDPPLSGL